MIKTNIKAIKKAVITFATAVLGCFTRGYWINSEKWTNDKGWKN